jgi:hypothetical protein
MIRVGGHLSSIGFGGEQWQSSVMEASSRSRLAGKSDGNVEHYLWADSSGARVVYHAKGGDLLCLSPGFRASTPTAWTVRTAGALLDADCLYCSGADCDVLDGRGELVTRATVQFELFAPWQRFLEQTRTFRLELAGFVHWARLCRDEAELQQAFAARGLGDMKLASTAFIPVGMFGTEKKGVTERATSLITGRVEEVERLRNGQTGTDFLRLRVATLPGTIDLAAAVDVLEGPPEPGRLIFTEVWLSGRPEERKN